MLEQKQLGDAFIQEFTAAVSECIAGSNEFLRVEVREYEPPLATVEQNQFLLMLKPELLAGERVDVGAVGEIITSAMADHGVVARAVAVVSSRALVQDRLIERHYGLLNRAARDGTKALSPRTAAALARIVGDTPVLGAYPFLSANPDFSTRALETICRNVETVKIGSGVYAISVHCDGQPIVILNPFHPRQLEHFCAPGGAVAVFECRSTRRLASLRRDFVGTTDPTQAECVNTNETVVGFFLSTDHADV